jgi:hypothetical protein
MMGSPLLTRRTARSAGEVGGEMINSKMNAATIMAIGSILSTDSFECVMNPTPWLRSQNRRRGERPEPKKITRKTRRKKQKMQKQARRIQRRKSK